MMSLPLKINPHQISSRKDFYETQFIRQIILRHAICITFLISVGAQAANLKIGPKGEQLLFDKTSLMVKAGEKVKLTLNNTSGMQHNWVLVMPGDLRPKLGPTRS